MSPGVVKRIERTHAIDAWVGDEERLNRLVRILDGLVEKGQARSTPDGGPLELVATATESGALTIRGEPAEVFSEMDRSALRKLELEVSSSPRAAKRDMVRVAFDRKEGVKLESRGETNLIDEFHASLAEELDRGIPRWAWMRGDAGAFLVWLVAFGELGLLIWTSAFADEDGLWTRLVFGVILGAGFGALVATLAVWSIVRLALPGFEVVRPGENGKGARAMAIAGTILLAIFGAAASWLLG